MMTMYNFNISSVREVIHLTRSPLLDPIFSCSCMAMPQNRAAQVIGLVTSEQSAKDIAFKGTSTSFLGLNFIGL